MTREPGWWPNAGKEARFRLIGESLLAHRTHAEAVRIMGRVRKHFRGKPTTDFLGVLNVALRESWRETHGNTDEWDAAARAAGTILP